MSRKQRGGLVPVPDEEGRLLWEAARDAYVDGRSIFTCAVTVTETTGSGVGSGRKGTRFQDWSVAELVEAVESLGWKLADIDHVWVHTEHNTALGASLLRGVTRAHLLFRRAPEPTTV